MSAAYSNKPADKPIYLVYTASVNADHTASTHCQKNHCPNRLVYQVLAAAWFEFLQHGHGQKASSTLDIKLHVPICRAPLQKLAALSKAGKQGSQAQQGFRAHILEFVGSNAASLLLPLMP